ncbi:MAG TPA: class I SAM-dependent methyltransferase [Gemmatimonadales bacterium]|jgi:ubiquinone/menaquinone biosynthesis C-methylase UbiE|nr:class I SAM-dependent methyltransferase [Gemmatimonadales bacterium]
MTLKERVRAEYDALAGVYEQRWSRYIEASTAATLRRLPLDAGTRVLDVGCGTGVLLGRLVGRSPFREVTGVDLSPGMVAQARRRLPASVRLLVGDAEALPFAAASFDVVVSASSFHYWTAPTRGLDELRRVLRPGGHLVITDWCDDYLACRLCDRVLRLVNPSHAPIYGGRECGALLSRARFQVTSLERYRISWLWGLMTAAARAPAG